MAIEKVLTPEVLAMIGKESSTEVAPDEHEDPHHESLPFAHVFSLVSLSAL